MIIIFSFELLGLSNKDLNLHHRRRNHDKVIKELAVEDQLTVRVKIGTLKKKSNDISETQTKQTTTLDEVYIEDDENQSLNEIVKDSKGKIIKILKEKIQEDILKERIKIIHSSALRQEKYIKRKDNKQLSPMPLKIYTYIKNENKRKNEDIKNKNSRCKSELHLNLNDENEVFDYHDAIIDF